MHLLHLPADVVEVVASHVDSVQTLCNFAQSSTACASLLSRDSCWRALAFRLYGHDFWLRAKQRAPRASRPLGSWRRELLRIEHFQAGLFERHSIRWTHSDFYELWDCLDGLQRD